jgi:hypothetical protein
MKILLDSQFPQSDLMRDDVLLKYFQELGMKLSKEELEFYDKHEIIRPAVRFRYEIDKVGFLPRHFFSLKNREMKTIRERIELSTDGDFQLWKDYEKTKHERQDKYHADFLQT